MSWKKHIDIHTHSYSQTKRQRNRHIESISQREKSCILNWHQVNSWSHSHVYCAQFVLRIIRFAENGCSCCDSAFSNTMWSSMNQFWCERFNQFIHQVNHIQSADRLFSHSTFITKCKSNICKLKYSKLKCNCGVNRGTLIQNQSYRTVSFSANLWD